MCHCVTAVSAYTSAGPLSLKQNGVYTSVITSVCTDCPLRTLHTIDDEDEHHVPHKDILESQDDEFRRSVRVRDAWPAVRSMLWTVIRVFAEQLPLVLTVELLNQETCVTCPPRTLCEVLRNNSHRGGIACFGEVVCCACSRNEAGAWQVRGELASVGLAEEEREFRRAPVR